MEWNQMFESPTQLTALIIALLIAKKALDLVSLKVRDSMGLKSEDGLAIQKFVRGCSVDPNHFSRVMSIDTNTKRSRDISEQFEDRANRGEFSCVWKDRDEISDLKAMVRENTAALKALTQYLQRSDRND